MDAVSTSTPAARASAPQTLRMVEGLRRLRRASAPEVVATRRVWVRVRPGAERETVYQEPGT